MKTFIIAEAGVNHNGCIETAKKLVDVAVNVKVDAVKFQSFKASKLVSKKAEKAKYQIENSSEKTETQFEMLSKLELSREEQLELYNYCLNSGILFMSTPFDEDSLTTLVNECNLSIIKLSSGDLTNAPLLLNAAQTGRDIIISTGMSTLEEIEKALAVLAYGYSNPSKKPSGFEEVWRTYLNNESYNILKDKVTILHCTTEYPASPKDVNLNVLSTIHSAFGLKVGFSDHTEGIHIPIAAVAKGASVIEKHFTLDKSMPGPDHKASLEPSELEAMVHAIRDIEVALGTSRKFPSQIELENSLVARKSIVAKLEIQAGTIFSEDNIEIKRPGNGMSPFYYWDLIGKKSKNTYDLEGKIDE
ncbi:MAG: N-acetylneuraminate synthase [Bacillales bacterium]|jgi:N-acetylneuraminate synthase|nr:N-acetylneuraminate synthase [Bacillales bacterium]